MSYSKIEFRQNRDFGQILNVSAAFISQNFTQLLQVALLYGLPWILLSAILNGFQPIFHNNFFNNGLYRIFLLLFETVIYGILCSLFLSYIQLYQGKEDAPIKNNEVWKNAQSNILRIILIGIMYSLAVVFGVMLFILPGIYWGVKYSFIISVSFFERENYYGATARCSELIKGNHPESWDNWLLLASLSLIIVLFSFSLNFAFEAVFQFLEMTEEMLVLKDQGSFSILLFVNYFLQSIVDVFITLISTIPFTFAYFSLVENLESQQLEKQIESFGEQD